MPVAKKLSHKMEVIPETNAGARSILEPAFARPAMSGVGPLTCTCGCCGHVLLRNVDLSQVRDVIVRCFVCGSCNLVDTVQVSH